MGGSPGKIQWHPGFYGAAELELHGNVTELTFQTEVELSKKPLRVDLLVIKTEPGTVVENETGRIFRGYNIIEYKSPDDDLTIDDFYKTIGYACLYKALGRTVNQFPAEEITVSLFRDTYPRELFKALKESGKEVEERYPGVYYVSNELPFKMQVVVTKQLEGHGHSAFRILSSQARMDDVKRFIEEASQYTDPGDRRNADAVLQVSISANKALYEEIRRDSGMCEALEDLMKDVIEKRVEQGVQQGAQQATLDNLRSMMRTLKLTAEQAMDALQIPPSEQPVYLKKIQ